MQNTINNEENGVFFFEAPEKIENLTFEKWQYWLTEKTTALDEETGCGTVYRAPITGKDTADIYQLKEEISVTISSGTKDIADRADRIIELATEHQADFDNFYPFTHFYFLLEFSPERPIIMDEFGKVLMELTGLVKQEGLSPEDYFWAAESVKGLGNNLKVTIRAGK